MKKYFPLRIEPSYGALAQLVERYDGIVEANGSNPLRSILVQHNLNTTAILNTKTRRNTTHSIKHKGAKTQRGGATQTQN
jgi:hypothetical protein